MNTTLLLNSLGVSALATAAALAAGTASAVAVLGGPPALRRFWMISAVTVLALPPFLVVNSWMDLFGRAGQWQAWLPGSLYSPGGVALVLALMFWPVPFLMLLGAWQRLQSEHFEVEPRLTGFGAWRWLLWPAARSALGLSAALLLVLTLNQFSVPALFQVKVLPAELWVRFNTTFDTWGGLAASWPLVLVPALALWIWRRPEVAWPRRQGGVCPALWRARIGRTVWVLALAAGTGTLLLALGIPLVPLLGESRTWTELGACLAASATAIGRSAGLAAATATVVLGLAVVLARHSWASLAWLTFLVPGVVLGIGLIVVLNRPVLVALYQSLGVVVLAWTLRFFAPCWQAVSRGLHSLDRDLLDAARLEGARGWTLFRLVYWPQTSRSLLAGWYLVYLLCLWDTETLILIMPPGGETLALRIFNFLHYGHQAQVNALCVLLLALALLPVAVYGLTRVARRLRPNGGLVPAPWCVLALLGFGLTGCSGRDASQGHLDSRLFAGVQVIGSRGAGPGQFHKPRSVAVDGEDQLYVVDMTGRVQRFASDGRYLGHWQMPQTDLGKPKGMCRDERGQVVVLEPHYARVNHYTAEGRLVDQWGRRGTNRGELGFPRAIAVGADGRAYVSEYMAQERVQVFRREGRQVELNFGSAGTAEGQFNRAEGIALDLQGRICVADSCNHRVQVFAPDGRFERAYGRPGSGPGEFSYPYDVRVDSAGYHYVCEFGNSRIQVFDGAGHLVEILGGPGALPGQFSNPWSLALDSQGNLYVADSMNHRVQKFIRRKGAG